MTSLSTCSCCDLPALSCGRRPELDIASPRTTSPMHQSLATWLSSVWVTADTDDMCDICGEDFFRGEEIRATGIGGWQGRNCCGGVDR